MRCLVEQSHGSLKTDGCLATAQRTKETSETVNSVSLGAALISEIWTYYPRTFINGSDHRYCKMSKFRSQWRTVSGVVGGFSAGAAVSVLLLRHFDKHATTTAASPTDQLFETEPTSTYPETLSADRVPLVPQRKCYDDAIHACRELVLQTKEEMGIPGVCVAVNVDGKTAWTEGEIVTSLPKSCLQRQ